MIKTSKVILHPFHGPSKQRGIIIATAIFESAAAPQVIVTDIVTSNTALLIAYSGARFNDNGSIDEISGVLNTKIFTPIHAGEWWSAEPEVAIGNDYDIRCQSIDLNGPWNEEAAIVGTYVGLDTNPFWGIHAVAGKIGANTKLITATMQIRLGVSPFTVLDTFELDCTAERIV